MRIGLGTTGAIVVSLIICSAALQHDERHDLHRRAALPRARAGPVAAAICGLERQRQQSAQRHPGAERDRLRAGHLRGADARRFPRRWSNTPRRCSGSSCCWSGSRFFVLRQRDPGRERPFRVPLYPVTPALFCLTCAYLLYSSLVYTGVRRDCRRRGAAARPAAPGFVLRQRDRRPRRIGASDHRRLRPGRPAIAAGPRPLWARGLRGRRHGRAPSMPCIIGGGPQRPDLRGLSRRGGPQGDGAGAPRRGRRRRGDRGIPSGFPQFARRLHRQPAQSQGHRATSTCTAHGLQDRRAAGAQFPADARTAAIC